MNLTVTGPIEHIKCSNCFKVVSTGFVSIPIAIKKGEIPYTSIVIRAFIECPECIQSRYKLVANEIT